MNRRGFLGLLGALPFVGKLVPKREKPATRYVAPCPWQEHVWGEGPLSELGYQSCAKCGRIRNDPAVPRSWLGEPPWTNGLRADEPKLSNAARNAEEHGLGL